MCFRTPAAKTPGGELEVFNWDFMSNVCEDYRKHPRPIFIVNEKETRTHVFKKKKIGKSHKGAESV